MPAAKGRERTLLGISNILRWIIMKLETQYIHVNNLQMAALRNYRGFWISAYKLINLYMENSILTFCWFSLRTSTNLCRRLQRWTPNFLLLCHLVAYYFFWIFVKSSWLVRACWGLSGNDEQYWIFACNTIPIPYWQYNTIIIPGQYWDKTLYWY